MKFQNFQTERYIVGNKECELRKLESIDDIRIVQIEVIYIIPEQS